MTHATISTYFNWSLWLGLPLGLLLMFFWGRKIYKPLARTIERDEALHLKVIAMRATLYSLPGIFVMILCSVPALYFGYLLKQHRYCVDVVGVNKNMSKDHPDLKQRCGRFDVDELFALGRPAPPDRR